MDFLVPFLFFFCFAIALVGGFAVVHVAKTRRLDNVPDLEPETLLSAPPLPHEEDSSSCGPNCSLCL